MESKKGTSAIRNTWGAWSQVGAMPSLAPKEGLGVSWRGVGVVWRG